MIHSGDALLETDAKLKVMSPKELSGYASGDIIYLALLGRIYDVTRGKKHYGPGGGYHFFSGKKRVRCLIRF